MTVPRVAVIGSGRVGLSLARALAQRNISVAVLGTGAQVLPPPLAPALPVWDRALAAADLVLIAVSDDAIPSVALALARSGTIDEHHTVLHTSGLYDRSSLAALDASGAALGSWHPVQTFADPEGDPDLLVGSPVVIEGDARACVEGRLLAERLGMGPVVEISADRKASYHAACVFASNYVVVLATIAARLARDAADETLPAGLFIPLMRQTVENLGRDPAATLTGPIRRGDRGTVERHLQALEGSERAIYIALARETLRLAREAGLDAADATSMEQLLY